MLVVVILGGAVSATLAGVAVLVTTRFQGWGRAKFAPPAIPWLVAAIVTAALTLAAGIFWALA